MKRCDFILFVHGIMTVQEMNSFKFVGTLPLMRPPITNAPLQTLMNLSIFKLLTRSSSINTHPHK